MADWMDNPFISHCIQTMSSRKQRLAAVALTRTKHQHKVIDQLELSADGLAEAPVRNMHFGEVDAIYACCTKESLSLTFNQSHQSSVPYSHGLYFAAFYNYCYGLSCVTFDFESFLRDHYRPARRYNVTITAEVASLAKHIYDSKDWEAAPILADMLEENSCPDTELVAHLRKQGICRGWWSLDLLTGKS